jgi:hypothetical protein
MLSIRFYNISVFIVPYKEFAEKNGSPIIELYCSIQVTPISKLTASKITIENINCQILRKVHIVTYKIFHQFYMVTTIAKPDTDYE